VASIKQRSRKDGSPYFDVMFRLDGRQRSVSFQTETHAQKFRNLIELVGAAKAMDVYNLNRTPRALNHGPTVAEWLEHHINNLTGVEKKTLSEYRAYAVRDIGPELGDIALASLTRENVARWVNAMDAAGASGKTIQNKHGFLSGALKIAVTDGIIPSNPCVGQRLPRTERAEPVFLTKDEFRFLHDAFSEHYKPLVEFLVASGARFSEATALTPQDIDRQAGTVRIWRSWKHVPGGDYELGAPKTSRSVRTINVPLSVLETLDYSREWLFLNGHDNPVRIYGWRENVWYPAVGKARARGLKKKPRVHDLRHTCASWLIAAGIPLPVIQRHLGHESISTTVNLYGHLDRRSHEAAADAIHSALYPSEGSEISP
jgi:integrase